MGFGFSGFSVLFTIMFLFIFGMIVFTIIKGISQWSRNNASPQLTVDAIVVTKRISTSHHMQDMGNGAMHNHTSTAYYATFQVESGDRMEFCVSGKEYGMLAEGDCGRLTLPGDAVSWVHAKLTQYKKGGLFGRLFSLPHKVCHSPALALRRKQALRTPRLNALYEPRHVPAEVAQNLHSFKVLPHLIGRLAKHHVPVGRRDHRHLRQREILVQHIHRSHVACPPRNGHGRAGLVCKEVAAAVKRAIQKGKDASGGVRKIHRRAEHESIRLLCFRKERIHAIPAKRAGMRCDTCSAIHTILHRFVPHPEDLRANAFMLQRFRNGRKRSVGAAPFVRAAVEQKYVHSSFPFPLLMFL